MVQVTLTSTSNLHSLDEFKNLIVKQINGSNIRLSDVAEVELGADSYEAKVRFDGKNGVFIGIQIATTANLLTVIKGVRAVLPRHKIAIASRFGSPRRLRFDQVRQCLDPRSGVTLIEALVIVMCVIFAFLGSPRSFDSRWSRFRSPWWARSPSCWRSDFPSICSHCWRWSWPSAGGGRCHHRRRKCESASGGWDAARGRGDAGGPRACQPHRCDDRGAVGRLHPHRVSGRPHRRALYRIRLYIRGRSDRFRDHRLDSFAHDVLAIIARAARRSAKLGITRHSIHRYPLRADPQRLPAPLEASLRYTPVTALFVVVIMVSIFLLYRSARVSSRRRRTKDSCWLSPPTRRMRPCSEKSCTVTRSTT